MADSLTLESLNAMMDKIPPIPFFASSIFFERTAAMKFQFKMKEYVGAHPIFWGQLPKLPSQPGIMQSSPCNIPIHDLDAEGNDELRKEFFTALRIIMESGAGPIEDAIATAIERG